MAALHLGVVVWQSGFVTRNVVRQVKNLPQTVTKQAFIQRYGDRVKSTSLSYEGKIRVNV